MRKRSPEQRWKVILAAVALTATAMALYIQLFERRVRQEQDRRAAARLEEALAESRLRLKTEILAELRVELAQEAGSDGQPLPDAVLRRSESGGSALQQIVGPLDSLQLRENLDDLSRQMEQSDRALRQNVEDLRAEIRRDLDASQRVASLLLAAMIPLVANLLLSIWQPRRWRREEEDTEREVAGSPAP